MIHWQARSEEAKREAGTYLIMLQYSYFPRSLSKVIIERAGRNDGGTYQCWDTTGEAGSISKQVLFAANKMENTEFYH